MNDCLIDYNHLLKCPDALDDTRMNRYGLIHTLYDMDIYKIHVEQDVGIYLHKEYYANGVQSRRCIFIDGVPHGDYTETYENGSIAYQCNYVHGLIQNSAYEFYPTGELFSISHYVDNYRTDKYFEYYKDNSIYLICVFQNGKRNGKCLSFYQNGNREYECYFRNDQLIGNYIYYNNDDASTIKYQCNYDSETLCENLIDLHVS
jgi:antitoxin component YwqK of YwqJK toxin-antitoxin module